MADERTTDETSASSDALLVGGSSASPSPTPTFAGTGRPQRRARRLRWQAGIPRSALALSAFSCALLLAGVVNYAFAVPGMLYKPAVAPLNPMSLILAANASDDGGLAGAAGSSAQARGAVGPVAATGAQAQMAGASAALGLGSSSSALGATSLVTGASAVDSSFAKAVEAAKENESAKSDSATGSNANSGASAGGSSDDGSSSGGSSDSSGGSGSDSEPATPSEPSGPSEAEEAQIHAELVKHLERANGYVTRLNNAITVFGNDAMNPSRDVRKADYEECAKIDSLTLTDFLTLRNYACPSDSRWAEQKSNLQRAYIAIDQYLTVYYDAWTRNLDYDNPADGVDYWMETIRADQAAGGGTSAQAAQLNEVLASISL